MPILQIGGDGGSGGDGDFSPVSPFLRGTATKTTKANGEFVSLVAGYGGELAVVFSCQFPVKNNKA